MTTVSNESSEHFNSSRYQFIVAKFSLHTHPATSCRFDSAFMTDASEGAQLPILYVTMITSFKPDIIG